MIRGLSDGGGHSVGISWPIAIVCDKLPIGRPAYPDSKVIAVQSSNTFTNFGNSLADVSPPYVNAMTILNLTQA